MAESSSKRFLWIVITSVTGLVAGSIYASVARVWGKIVGGLWWCVSVSVPVPISILSVLVILLLLFIIAQHRPKPDFTAYVQDEIRGMIWQWNWSNNTICNLHCLCPHDLMEMSIHNHQSDYSDIRYTHDFQCERCGFRTQKFDYEAKNTLDFARKEIVRKIRTGEWKDAVAKQLGEGDKIV